AFGGSVSSSLDGSKGTLQHSGRDNLRIVVSSVIQTSYTDSLAGESTLQADYWETHSRFRRFENQGCSISAPNHTQQLTFGCRRKVRLQTLLIRLVKAMHQHVERQALVILATQLRPDRALAARFVAHT